MQFYGMSFVYPHKQAGRRQDVLDIKHILPSTGQLYGYMKEIPQNCMYKSS